MITQVISGSYAQFSCVRCSFGRGQSSQEKISRDPWLQGISLLSQKVRSKTLFAVYKRALQEGDGDFWSLVHRPFIDNQLTRDTVCALIDMTRRDGARNMPDIAAALRACEPYPQTAGEQRRFYKFKNFLYKTVKI